MNAQGRDATAVRNDVTRGIDFIASNNSKLRAMVKRLSRSGDDEELNNKANDIANRITENIRAVSNQLKVLNSLIRDDEESKAMYRKLLRDFQGQVNVFKEVQRDFKEQSATQIRAAKRDRTVSNAGASEDQPLLGPSGGGRQQQYDVIDSEIEFYDNLIEERETNIVEIETNIQEVNEIFRDLASLVDQQGEVLNRIEDNIDVTNVRVEKGVDDLGKANRYQKGYRSKLCCLLLCVVIIAAVIVVVVKI